MRKICEGFAKKISIFKTETKTRKSVFLCMDIAFGIEQNIHSIGIIQNDISIDALSNP